MPSYEICYLNEDGTLAATFATMCLDTGHAKIIAHAMALEGTTGIEVWQDRTLVYRRSEDAN